MRRVEVVAGALAVLAAVGAACGGGDTKSDPFGSDVVRHVEVASQGGDYRGSIDAAPTSDGKSVYFTAGGPNRPGLFRLPADGGRAQPVAVGAPFQKPVGVAVSTDGTRVFVADTETGGRGAVLTVTTTGSGVTPVQGTTGTAPRGVEIVREGGQDVLYFTGKAADGTVGVFKLPANGAASATTVLKGSPLADPDAVTATRVGVVFVTDRAAGAVYRITDGAAERIADIRAPQLAGVTLTLDESTLLVSALNEDGTDRVAVIDVATLKAGSFTKTIGANRDGGGLHRAHDVNVFAWADLAAGPDRQGRVYVLRP